MKAETIEYIKGLLEEERISIENQSFNGFSMAAASFFYENNQADLREIDQVIDDFEEYTKELLNEQD